MFASLPEADRAQLADVLHEEVIPAGRVLFDVGDPGSSMYIVRSGRVRISIPGESGDEVTLATLGHGEFFGELALLDGQPRSARATVVDAETTVYRLERDEFSAFIATRPGTALAMLSATARRLRHTDELMRSRAATNVNEELEKDATLGDRLADVIARFGGSWGFSGFYFAFLLLWVGINTWVIASGRAFDPYPYVFLNFVVACLAALQAPIIMMSQNRDAVRDRLRADADFKVNLKNEVGIERAIEKIDELRNVQLADVRRQVREQGEVVRRQGELVERLVRAANGFAPLSNGDAAGAGAGAHAGTGSGSGTSTEEGAPQKTTLGSMFRWFRTKERDATP